MLFSTRTLQTALVTSLLATGITFCTAQDQPAAPKASTTKPAAKTGTSTAAKTGTASKTAAPALTTQKDKVSYSIGADIGRKLKADQLDVDPAIVVRGLHDGFNGTKLALTDEQIRATFMQLQAEMQAKQMEAAKAAGEKNKKDGEAFLAANKSRDGVVTLPSGLQYKVLKAGDGPKPAASDTVICNYRGTLVDGKEFDSSYKRGEPATFPVSGVIKGWTEALQLMPVGSKWQLVIPPDLAYGQQGAGRDIGPDSTLVFEVELISIQDKSAAKPAAMPNNDSMPADAKPADTAKPADAPQNK